MQTSSDTELLNRIRAGDKQAYTVLYEKYGYRLFGYCYRMVQHRQTAEDLVQMSFIKAFEALNDLQKPELFYSWLFSIARNEIYGFARHKRRNGTLQSLEEEDVWDTESPLALVLRDETTELVQKCLKQLKLEYREILILREYDRLSYAEIALITGDSISSIESRLFKARKALAKKLGPFIK